MLTIANDVMSRICKCAVEGGMLETGGKWIMETVRFNSDDLSDIAMELVMVDKSRSKPLRKLTLMFAIFMRAAIDAGMSEMVIGQVLQDVINDLSKCDDPKAALSDISEILSHVEICI